MRVLANVKDSQIWNTDLQNACASIINNLKYTFDSASDIYLIIYKMFYLYVVLKKNSEWALAFKQQFWEAVP